MGKTAKVILLVATLWPFCGFAIMFFFGVSIVAHMTPGKSPQPTDFPPAFGAIFGLQCFTMLLMLAMLAFYITNVFRNPRVGSELKPLWAVVLFLGGLFAMPVYWYFFIWKDSPNFPTEMPSSVVVASAVSESVRTTTSSMRRLLHRYWLKFASHPRLPARGCGVTAFTLEDALALVRQQILQDAELPALVGVVEDVDIRTLDQGHVIPNMEEPVSRGIWFPIGVGPRGKPL